MRGRSMVRRGVAAAVTALGLAAVGPAVPGEARGWAAEAVAAQEGFVAGEVVDATSLQPLAGAQVLVVGTGQGALTDTRGRFRIQGVSGAEATVRVVMLGYRVAERVVRVGDPSIRIVLEEEAVALDRIVVTGTPGGTRKRAIGNSVAAVDASQIQNVAPAEDVSSLLNGRAPGVTVLSSSGQAGGGTRVRIRGQGSLSLSNEPLLYVDGVRVDNAPARGFDWMAISRLNDIDPNDIESIEIIKGPAAATLYGTEASNGVIQIITKKGGQGEPRVTLNVSQGVSWLHDPEGRFATSYMRLPSGDVETLNLVQLETERGAPIFRDAHVQRYGVDVRGGTAAVQYFLDANYEDEQGVLAPNGVQRFNGRANIQAQVRDNFDVSVNGGYVSSLNEAAHYDLLRGPYMPVPALLNTPARGWLVGTPEAIRAAYDFLEDVSRFTGGVQFNYQPLEWWSNRLSVGVDDVNEEANTIVPRLQPDVGQFFGQDALGRRTTNAREVTTTTVDYAGTANLGLTESLGTSTSFGVQYYRRFENTSQIVGRGFPAPGVTTVSSAADRTVTATSVENVTFGVYVQEQLAWNDRLFLTAAVRADDNSAFGEDFDLVTYPKVSAAWVVSEEPFWSLGFLNTLRLRAAYGESGQQPDAFAALQTFEPVPGPGGVAAVRPQFPGNAELGPERGKEIEAGFEAGLLEDRLGVDFTYYRKRTEDAILQRALAPSSGFPSLQFINIGAIENRGFEALVTALPFQSQTARLDLTFSLAHNENEITDMGEFAEISAAPNQYHRVGFPVAGFFERVVVSADVGPNGALSNLMCDGGVDGRQGGAAVPCAGAPRVYIGQPVPTWEGAFNANLTLWERLTLTGLIDFKNGHRVFSSDIAIQCHILRVCRENVFPDEAPVRAGEMALSIFGPAATPEVSYAKLRQIAASYQLPDALAGRIGASSAQVTVSARNLHTWTDFEGPEPEAAALFNSQYVTQFQQLPQPRQFLTSVRVSF